MAPGSLCMPDLPNGGMTAQWKPYSTHAPADYIQDRGSYLQQRFRLGVEIKNREEKLLPRFREYQSIVNTAMVRPPRERQM